MPARSRPARCRVPTAWPSTTSCCASRKNSAIRRATPDVMRSASAVDFSLVGLGARLRSQGLTWVLAAAVVLLQYPLWLGEGGWLKVRERARNIDTQQALNLRLQTRNAGLL